MRPQKCAKEDINYHQFADLVRLLFFHVMVALNCFDFEYAADFMLPCLFLVAILTTVHGTRMLLCSLENDILKTREYKKKGNAKLAEADACHKI
jgi:hypothetical protein